MIFVLYLVTLSFHRQSVHSMLTHYNFNKAYLLLPRTSRRAPANSATFAIFNFDSHRMSPIITTQLGDHINVDDFFLFNYGRHAYLIRKS